MLMKWKVLALAMLFIIAHSLFTISLHHSFNTTAGDLGKFVQAYWSTLNGYGLFYTTFHMYEFNPTGSYLGEHLALLHFLILPFFALFPSPETLLVIKAVANGLSVAALYLICREVRLGEKVTLAILLAYMFSPHLTIARVFDFQEHAFLPLLLFTAYYAYLREKPRLFSLFIVLSLLVGESVAPLVACLLKC